jgi:hypothetical protein
MASRPHKVTEGTLKRREFPHVQVDIDGTWRN